MLWIQGHSLPEPIKAQIMEHVRTGRLIPYESPDADWIKKYSVALNSIGCERVFRVFPPIDHLKEKWRTLEGKKIRLNLCAEILAKTDQDLDEERAALEALCLGSCTIRNSREDAVKIMAELEPEIKALEAELAPSRVWGNLDLGPAGEQMILDLLLESFYRASDVGLLGEADSPQAEEKANSPFPGGPSRTPARALTGEREMKFFEYVSAKELIADGTFNKDQLVEFALSGVQAYNSIGEPQNLLLPILLAAKTLANSEASQYSNLIKDLVQGLRKTITTSQNPSSEEALRCMKMAALLEKSDRLTPFDEELLWEEIFQSQFKREDVDRYLTPALTIYEHNSPDYVEGYEADEISAIKDELEDLTAWPGKTLEEVGRRRRRKDYLAKILGEFQDWSGGRGPRPSDSLHAPVAGEFDKGAPEPVAEVRGQGQIKEIIGHDAESPPRKTDYRTLQWEKAVSIAEHLYKANDNITLKEIKNDPAFKACFENGMPADDTIREHLNVAGIRLAPGKRKGTS